MARRPAHNAGVTLFYGDRSLSLPLPLAALLAAIVAGAVAVTAANTVSPWLAGTRPVFTLPPLVETLLGLIAFAAGMAGLIAVNIMVLGWLETRRADRRFAAHDKLVSLADAARQDIQLAPNLPQDKSAAIVARLQALQANGTLTSVHIPLSGADATSSDSVFVATGLDARALRRALAPLACDEIARVPARHRARLSQETGTGTDALWLLVWD